MTESTILKLVRLAASRLKITAWRNNVGAVRDPMSDNFIRYGVANPGGSDLIGYYTLIVQPEHIGKSIAVFTAIECKTTRGRLTPEQENFLNQVGKAGGIAIVARTELDVERGVQQWSKTISQSSASSCARTESKQTKK